MVDHYEQDTQPLTINLEDTLSTMVRMGVQIAGVVIIVVGLYCMIDVFTQVGAFLQEPEKLKDAHADICQLIGAEGLKLTIQKEQVELGKLSGMLVLFLWYSIWVWIPVAIVTAGGKMISSTISDRKENRQLMREVALCIREAKSQGDK